MSGDFIYRAIAKHIKQSCTSQMKQPQHTLNNHWNERKVLADPQKVPNIERLDAVWPEEWPRRSKKQTQDEVAAWDEEKISDVELLQLSARATPKVHTEHAPLGETQRKNKLVPQAPLAEAQCFILPAMLDKKTNRCSGKTSQRKPISKQRGTTLRKDSPHCHDLTPDKCHEKVRHGAQVPRRSVHLGRLCRSLVVLHRGSLRVVQIGQMGTGESDRLSFWHRFIKQSVTSPNLFCVWEETR